MSWPRASLSLLFCALGVSLAAGQSTPKIEIFGGVSVERVGLCGPATGNCNSSTEEGPTTSTHAGWNVAATGYIFKGFGVTADFARHSGQSSVPTQPANPVHTSDISYLFGPVYAYRMPSGVTPFAHALFGIVRRHVDPLDISPNPFAWLVGGGLDLAANRHVAIRLGEFDYERLNLPASNASANSVSGFRYSGGIVVKF
jgi:hypothetical protein